MPDPPQSTSRSRRPHGPTPAWLRLVSVCVVLIAVPVGLYLFLYQRSRIEDATIRSFRALDAAAGRVDEVLVRLPRVVGSSSFGVSSTMLDEVTKQLTGRTAACSDDHGFRLHRAWNKPKPFPSGLLGTRRPTPAHRLEYRYWLAADKLFESNEKDDGATEALWNQLHCLVDTHHRFSEPGETVSAEVTPMRRPALVRWNPACADGVATPRCIRRRRLQEAEACGARSPTLNAGSGGIEATVVDCRRIEERSPELYRALRSFRGAEGVIRAIDLFGTRSAADLDDLMNEATGHLSRFFDSHLIADADGRILFEAEGVEVSGTEVDESHVATPDFSSYVDISELLRAESARPDGGAAAGASDGSGGRASGSAVSFRGRSFVRMVGADDIGLRVFVHPFILDGVDVPDRMRPDSPGGGALSDAAGRATFYLVGIVDDREFRSAAIRLRLRAVTDATLVLLTLLTFAPLLWLWTAGDRVVVGRFALLGVGVLPVVGVVLSTVVACGVRAHRLDEHALDRTVKHVSDRIAGLFDRELGGEIRRLQRAVPRLLARADRLSEAELAEWRGGVKRRPGSGYSGGETLTALERAFYCDDADRNLEYEPERPEAWSAFLLDDRGKQRVCLSEPRRARPARTPALGLEFRAYFEQPKEGVLWRSRLPTPPPRPVGCRIGDAQDEESLIPCLVDRLPEPSKRLFGVSGGAGSARSAEAPYFLERIDAVVGGQVATMLAVGTGLSETPVAVAGVSLNALDRAVPPRHVDFAVVDGDGRTLFHSDDELAMTTNFVEDTGRDAALWALMRSGARDTIALDYAGVPIRAHVRPLRPGMPWTLVVYRGHELEDRLGGLTVALAIFFTLLCLFLAALLTGLVLFVAHCRRPGSLPGMPAVIGRVMAAGSRFRWLAAAAAGAVPVLLLSSPWHGWTLAGAWRVSPFFVGYSVFVVATLVLHCVLGSGASPGDGDRDGGTEKSVSAPGGGGRDSGTAGRVFGLAGLIVALAVLPTALCFAYHRAALGIGLNGYLTDQTLASVDRGREQYRRDMLMQHGVAAPAGDRLRQRVREARRPSAGWVHRAVRPVVASSELANQLMTYRALPPAAADEVVSLRDVFATTFGYRIDPPPGVFSDFGRFLTAFLRMLALVALVFIHAYSVCASCTVVGRRRRGLVELPSAGSCPGQRLPNRPLRAIVVHRERGPGELLEHLRTWLPPYCVEKRAADSTHSVVDWMVEAVPRRQKVVHHPMIGRGAAEGVYVFGDLREVLEDGPEGRALFDELERLANDGSSNVLIGSRVVPDYRYAGRFRSGDGWFDRGHSDDADRRDRWIGLARQFRTYVMLHDSTQEGKRSQASVDASSACVFKEAMQREVEANPDLSRVAPGVSSNELADFTPREARALAVTTLRKGAASCFRQIWTESTREEQLQLYALARGGVVDARRTAALSSLVNRGLVRPDPGTGVVGLRSEALREFIEHDVERRELDAWRRQGGAGVWRFIWPPLAIGGALGLAFLAMANPEMRTTLLATLLGLLPAALPLLGGGRGGAAAGAGSVGG